MNYKNKLQEMKANELKDINGKLKIPGAKKLEKEIKKALSMGFWTEYRKFIFIIGMLGILLNITALNFSLTSQKDTIELKNRLNDIESTLSLIIDDPAAAQRIKKEYEKKLAAMEETLKNLKTEDKKARDEALKTLIEGDYSKSRKLFEMIRKKEKEKEKEHALTVYILGEIAFLKLNFNEALGHYLEAEKLEPTNTLYQYDIGLVYNTLGKYEKAN